MFENRSGIILVAIGRMYLSVLFVSLVSLSVSVLAVAVLEFRALNLFKATGLSEAEVNL